MILFSHISETVESIRSRGCFGDELCIKNTPRVDSLLYSLIGGLYPSILADAVQENDE